MGAHRVITARWFQDAAYNATIEYLDSGRGNAPLIALPTGTGKSVVVGLFCTRLLALYPNLRFLMLTHVKELIVQNYARLLDMWPAAPVGIYSAGLKQRDTALPIIFGGVASVVKNLERIGWRDVLIIDEAHLLANDDATMYAQVIAMLRVINPRLVVIGLTATPYRTGQGLLTDGGIFTHTVFDLTDVTGFNRLLAEGFLCPLYPKRTSTEYDLSGVGLGADMDFAKGALQKAVDKKDITRKVLEELCYLSADRSTWLIFASGVEHADHVAESLRNDFGIVAASVHSKMHSTERDARLKAYKAGQMRCLVSNNIATTGFDHPPIDLIGMLRPTQSTGLHVQMNGRGTRPSPETHKSDCLVLDFAGNTRRLGPINDPKIPHAKEAGGGDMPVRICDKCGVYNHASATVCMACGAEFSFAEKLMQTAGTDDIIRSDAAIVDTFEVLRVLYSYHQRGDKVQSMKVTYVCRGGIQSFNEWVCFDHGGAAGKKARDWFRARHGSEPPTPENCHPFENATRAALSCTHRFRVPRYIRVHVNTQFPTVMGVQYE